MAAKLFARRKASAPVAEPSRRSACCAGISAEMLFQTAPPLPVIASRVAKKAAPAKKAAVPAKTAAPKKKAKGKKRAAPTKKARTTKKTKEKMKPDQEAVKGVEIEVEVEKEKTAEATTTELWTYIPPIYSPPPTTMKFGFGDEIEDVLGYESDPDLDPENERCSNPRPQPVRDVLVNGDKSNYVVNGFLGR